MCYNEWRTLSWIFIDKIGQFQENLKVLRVGTKFEPLQVQWDTLVVNHDQAMAQLRGLRMSVEDHKDNQKD